MTFHSDDHQDQARPFDPRSEQFLESLRRLLEFEVELCHMTEFCYRQETLFSTDIVGAAHFAMNALEGDGWSVIQVRRTIEKEPDLDIPIPEDQEEFIAAMKMIFGED